VQAPVQTDRTGDALAELIDELQSITSSRPIEPGEAARVIDGLTRGLPGSFETTTAVLNSLVTSARYGRPLDYAATLTDRYQALRVSDLQSAAKEIVRPQSLVWIVIGDLSRIRDQVAKVNIGPIEIWNDDGEPVR
jgi:zinc protease